MANTTREQLRGLALSASELHEMTGGKWPPALIEDYLNIIDNTILLATTIDSDIDTTEGIIAAIEALRVDVADLNSRLDQSIIDQETRSNNIEQLLYIMR